MSHTDAGFKDFFGMIEHHKQQSGLSAAMAMEGFNGYGLVLVGKEELRHRFSSVPL